MKYLLTLLLAAFFIFSTTTSYSQQQQSRTSMVFPDFIIDSNSAGFAYKKVLHETLLEDLVSSYRFNIADRSPELWKVIEKEIGMQDFTNPKTAIQLGNMLGAQNLIDAKISLFTYERVFDKKPDGSIDYHFSCTINASIKLVNLETGVYQEAITHKITTSNQEREKAIQLAIQNICTNLANKLSQKFPIKATVVNLTKPDLVTINKGHLDGVVRQSIFHLRPSSSDMSSTPIATIKIISTTDNEATGKIIQGNYPNLASAAYSAVESFQEEGNILKIEKKEKLEVIINAGTNIGVKKGDVYNITRQKQLSTDSRIINEEVTLSRIYITSAEKDFSKGRIISGYPYVKEGERVIESKKDKRFRSSFLKIQYRSLISPSIKPYGKAGVASVVNTSGSYTINTQYQSDFKEIRNVDIFSVGFGWKNLVKDFSTVITFDMYRMSPLKSQTLYLDLNYEYPLIPEQVQIVVGGAIGYGWMKQDVPQNTLPVISNGYSSDLRANNLFLAANTGINWQIKHFTISGRLFFNYLSFNKWHYKLKVNDKEETATAPDEIVPYSKIKLSGVGYGLGLSYTF